MKDTLHQKFSIDSYHIDPSKKARLTAIANFLQETAYKHAHSLQLGYHHLAENESAWMLSRLHIRMIEYPGWDEEITVETWPRGLEKLFALRDFRIRNAAGDVIAEASTCWLMVSTKTHRPLRIPEDFIRLKTRTDSVFESTPGKINFPEDTEVCDKHKVNYADLDVVGHVNNVRYIEWCINTADPELILQNSIVDFSINFISEARLNDQVEIQRSISQKQEPGFSSDSKIAQGVLVPGEKLKYHVSGHNLQTGRECFRAVFLISAK